MLSTRRAGIAAARALVARRMARPLDGFPWLPQQHRVLHSPHKRRLFRAGEQTIGKSTVGLAEIIFAATGEHPYRTPTPRPGEYWIVCISWKQSIAIQAKLHALLAPADIQPGTTYSERRGFAGGAVQIRHASGGWSMVRFRTGRQGVLDLASATIDGVLIDEPPEHEATYTQLVKRVQRRGGWILLCMTPLRRTLGWLQARVDSGEIEDFQTALTPEELVPVGGSRPMRLPDGTPCDAAWIEKITSETPAHEVGIRIHGEWDYRRTGTYYGDAWRPGVLVVDEAPEVLGTIFLGIDHGHKPGKQCAYLMGVENLGERIRLWILDEYTDTTGSAGPVDDARGILGMLASNGLNWGDLDWAIGDRVHMPGTGQQKSNKDLELQLGKLVRVIALSGRPVELRPPVKTVHKRHDSLSVGSRWLYQRMQKPDELRILRRCERLIAAIPLYVEKDDGTKDPLDAVRYGCDPLIYGYWRAMRHSRPGLVVMA